MTSRLSFSVFVMIASLKLIAQTPPVQELETALFITLNTAQDTAQVVFPIAIELSGPAVVFNADGEQQPVIFTNLQLEGEHVASCAIPIAQLAPGAYVVKQASTGGELLGKFVKE
ncbi:MAG: hypothetical protein WBO28_09840 [Flavobacteriales bacterium]